MKKRKILSLLLAGAMMGQAFFVGALTASAEEGNLIGKKQLSDNRSTEGVL